MAWNKISNTKIDNIVITISKDDKRVDYYKFTLKRNGLTHTIETKVKDYSVAGMQDLITIYIEDFREDEERINNK